MYMETLWEAVTLESDIDVMKGWVTLMSLKASKVVFASFCSTWSNFHWPSLIFATNHYSKMTYFGKCPWNKEHERYHISRRFCTSY